MFDPAELAKLALRRGAAPETTGAVVLYGRVSSQRQRAEGDLDRQLDRLRTAAGTRSVAGEFYDVASGLSDKRKGLRRALDGGDGDLVRDMLAVVTSFAGGLYGARSARARALASAVIDSTK